MIEIKNLTKSFDGQRNITNDLSLNIEKGEFLAIIGRSGEGKSVLLKQIIGLIKPTSGEILIEGKDITQLSGLPLQEIFRKCGYVFQFAALLDSLTVLENVGIVHLESGKTTDEMYDEVAAKIKSVGLSEDSLKKYPDELSGGMKKRVGLARTLMQSPEILIYDEPTTGLDPISVKRIHELMKKTHDESNATTIVISHDVDIFNYADQVAMLYQGKIVYKGATKDVWDCDNPYLHQFIRGLSEGPIEQSL
ncbi:ABC transporter ATP-binding protein [Candidatus Dependentiae bacterium]|nr:MAG: ABC transporter ATP-binding protein [Candidatus Dependentiae bacterium]